MYCELLQLLWLFLIANKYQINRNLYAVEPSNMDTLGTKIFVLISEVSLRIYLYDVTCSSVFIGQDVLYLGMSFKSGST